ncbi:hypothetical protein FRC01_001849 [Tulasnella sp. 417]|nr:hypothetical protein FRC01_001849 [Tulasnella sp. 417]
MRLKKNHPTLDSTSAPFSASSSTVPLPPNTLRKPKPPPADALPPKEDPSASPPRQPSTLKKASTTARAMVDPSSSSRLSSSSSSSSSTTTASEAEVVSLNDDPDLKPEAPPSSSPTKRSQFTFRGWPTILEGSAAATKEVSASTHPSEHSVPPHGLSSPAPSSPLPSRTSPSSDQGYAADNDGDSVGSDRSVIQAVTVVNELDKYSLHIKFEDEVSYTADRALLSSSTPHSSTMPEGDEEVDPQRPITPPERRSGHFERCVQFGPDADPSRASARFDGETLVINVPKKRTWADVDVVHRSREEPTTPVLPQEKSPRSIALALAASPTTSTSTGSTSEKHLQLDESGGSGSRGSGSSDAVSPGAESTSESTTSTTPEGEMTSGSSWTDTSSVPSPMSEEGGSPLDQVSRRLDNMHLDLRDGSDEEDEGETRRASQERLSPLHPFHHQQYPTEPPTPTSFLPRRPSPFVASYPLSPNKQNSSEPSPIASWLSSTSATLPRSRSHSPPQPHQHGGARHASSSGSDSDSSEGRAAARRHFGIEDDLVTPTPQRVQKRRGSSGVEQPTAAVAAAAANHHAMSPKKDYFGFPLTPVLATTSDAEKTTPPKTAVPPSAPGFVNNHLALKQRSPTREAGPSGLSVSPSRTPLSLRRSSVTSVEEDAVEHMRISLPASPAAPPNPASGRTREQGMGRSAFFWKRWAPGQGS